MAYAISIDNSCLQLMGRDASSVPYHTRDQLDRLEKWLEASATLKFLEEQGRISFNRDRVKELSPNLAFYNFSTATNCVRGIDSSYDAVLRSLNTRLRDASSSVAIRNAYSVIDNVSRDLERDFRGAISVPPIQSKENDTDSPTGTAH